MQDILFGEDVEIKNGDFFIGDSENQHTAHILIANKGEYKSYPELGVGLEKMLNTDSPIDWIIEAKKNLQYDGQAVENIHFTEEGTLNVNSKYKK